MTSIQSVKCPHCGKQAALADNPSRPFCSERCKLIDLGTWATEGYRIPGAKAPQEEDESEE